jgi:23S rRNA pseudoU1915 N3-methylase RlmH
MNLDLMKFFKDKGYEKILNLAFALGGAQGSTSRVTLRARPTIRTDFGPLTYPGEIDIIDKEFRGK